MHNKPEGKRCIMFVTEGVYTRKVASEVGSLLKYLFEHPTDESYFELQLVRHHPDGDKNWTELVRLIPQVENRVVTLANGREIVRCVNKDGRRLDIFFGAIAEREIEPCLVILEDPSSPPLP